MARAQQLHRESKDNVLLGIMSSHMVLMPADARFDLSMFENRSIKFHNHEGVARSIDINSYMPSQERVLVHIKAGNPLLAPIAQQEHQGNVEDLLDTHLQRRDLMPMTDYCTFRAYAPGDTKPDEYWLLMTRSAFAKLGKEVIQKATDLKDGAAFFGLERNGRSDVAMYKRFLTAAAKAENNPCGAVIRAAVDTGGLNKNEADLGAVCMDVRGNDELMDLIMAIGLAHPMGEHAPLVYFKNDRLRLAEHALFSEPARICNAGHPLASVEEAEKYHTLSALGDGFGVQEPRLNRIAPKEDYVVIELDYANSKILRDLAQLTGGKPGDTLREWLNTNAGKPAGNINNNEYQDQFMVALFDKAKGDILKPPPDKLLVVMRKEKYRELGLKMLKFMKDSSAAAPHFDAAGSYSYEEILKQPGSLAGAIVTNIASSGVLLKQEFSDLMSDADKAGEYAYMRRLDTGYKAALNQTGSAVVARDGGKDSFSAGI
jgi:hypothetical protein